MSVKRTKARISYTFSWQSLNEDCRDCIKTCSVRQLKAPVTHRDRVPITPILIIIIIIIIIIRAFVRRTMSASELILTLTQYVFYIAQIPTVRPRAHYMVVISCYSEQYVRLKRNVFSRRRKATVDFFLFSSVGS